MTPSLSSGDSSQRSCSVVGDASYRRWFVIPASISVATVALGSAACFSLFIDPVHGECPSWSPYTVVHGFSLRAFMSGITPVLVGPDLTHRGPRTYASLGSALMALSVAMCAFAVERCWSWLFYTFSVFMGIGYGALYITCMQHLMLWFADRKGLAGAVFGLSVGGGGIVVTLVSALLLYYMDAADSLYVLAIVFLATSLPLCLCMRFPHEFLLTAPASMLSRVDEYKRLLAMPQFWLFVAVIFASVSPGWALVSVYASMFEQIAGVDNFSLAVWLTAAAAATQMLGRTAYPLMSDGIGARAIMIVILVLEAALFCALALSVRLAAPFVVPATLVCSIASLFGGSTALYGPAVMYFFGPNDANAVAGMGMLGMSAAALVSPNLVSLLVQLRPDDDQTAYNPFFWLMAVLLCVGALLAYFLESYTSKRRRDDSIPIIN